MIFVTVGITLPFDRLIRAVDEWTGARHRTDVLAQTGRGTYRPRHMQCVEGMDSSEYRRRVAAADIVVAHAGTGTILMARDLNKPLIVMPRRSHLKETRNDHQVATARELSEAGILITAEDEFALPARLDHALAFGTGTWSNRLSTCNQLIATIEEFVRADNRPAPSRPEPVGGGR